MLHACVPFNCVHSSQCRESHTVHAVRRITHGKETVRDILGHSSVKTFASAGDMREVLSHFYCLDCRVCTQGTARLDGTQDELQAVQDMLLSVGVQFPYSENTTDETTADEFTIDGTTALDSDEGDGILSLSAAEDCESSNQREEDQIDSDLTDQLALNAEDISAVTEPITGTAVAAVQAALELQR